MDKATVPSFNTDIAAKSGLNINSLSPGMPGGVPGLDLPNTNLPGANPNIPGTNVKTQTGLPNPNLNTGKLNETTGQAGDIQKQVKEATGSTEALGNVLENQAGKQVKGLPENKLPETPGLPGEIPQTGDQAKAQLVDMAKKEAVNHFAGKEQVLMGAMDKMSKYKQKYNSVNSLKDLKDEKPHNELRNKPLRERLVPALTLQFQSWRDLMLDINPSMGYKLNSHMVVGLGWN